MRYVIILSTLLSVSLAGCGGGGSNCEAAAKGYSTCFAQSENIEGLCEAQEEYGCIREEYWECHEDMNCSHQDCTCDECLAELQKYTECIEAAPPCD